jgi:hypothetical protein
MTPLLRSWLPDTAPTWPHWRHAALTVVVVAAPLALLPWDSQRVRLIAATAGAFMMQCTGVGPPRYEHWSVTASGVAMAALVLAGAALAAHPLAQQALLVATAVLAFAVRTRLPDAAAWTTFWFTITVLACAVGADRPQPWPEACAILITTAVAAPLQRLEGAAPRPAAPASPSPAVPPDRSLRMAWRAGLTALLAILIQELMELPRAYWSLIVGVATTSPDRQQLRTRIVDRALATALGCLVGWALHGLIQRLWVVHVPLLLATIFAAALWRPISFRLFIFCTTLYITFLFMILGAWSPAVLVVRCYETAIGLGLSLLAVLVVPFPPSHAAAAPTPASAAPRPARDARG